MIEIETSHTVRTSPETAWRHLTRISDWPRWYPGLHGLNVDDTTVMATGAEWRSSGQMGRMLYRGANQVTSYKLLDHFTIESNRGPWLSFVVLTIGIARDGVHTRLNIHITARPGMSLFGRLILHRTLRNRLRDEAVQIGERFADYTDHVLPHH